MHITKQSAIHLLSIVLSFLLAFITVVVLVLLSISTTISQPTYMKNKVISSNFSKQVSAELNELFSSYGAASGFEIDAFAPLLDENKIAQDMNKAIDNIYDPKSAIVIQDEVHQLIFTSLVSNVNTRGIVLTAEIQQGLDDLASTCAFDYVNKVSLPYVDYIASAITKVSSLVSRFNVGIWIAMAIAAACILYVNRCGHRCFRYFSYAFSSVFLVLGIVPIIVLVTDKLAYISLRPVSVNHFVVEYLNGVFYLMLSMAIGALILSVLCTGCYFAFRSKKVKPSSS